MKCDSLLVCGLGQCGGTLADLTKKVNKRYSTIYVNSSLGDASELEFADLDSNVFIYSGADGSGRNRDKAKQFIENDKLRLAHFLNRFKQFKYMLVYSSLGGGTGSGTLPEFLRTVSKVLPDIIINVVGVLPALSEETLQLQNALECCNELTEMLEDEDNIIIHDLKFINNESRKNKYNELNKEAILSIDDSYSRMTAHSSVGSIDEDNLTNVTTSIGCGVILDLPRRYISLEDAITEAQQDSVFAIPDNLACTYAAINVTDEYDIEDIVTLLEVEKTIYRTYNEKKTNMIVLGGCDFPSEALIDIEDELKSREINKKESKRSFGFKSKVVTEKKKTTINKRKIVKNEEDLDKLFDIDAFRF